MNFTDIGIYLKLWIFIHLLPILIGEASASINFEGLRLPRDIEPRNYDFTIKAYLPGYGTEIKKEQEFTFDATVRIKLRSEKPTNTIILNAINFTYNWEKSYAISTEKQRISIYSIIDDLESQKVAFVLESNIPEGYSELVIEYSGEIAETKVGIYRNYYDNEQGINTTGAVTQFEMIEARKMVPCFDEPIFKSRWTVTIIHPIGTTALSNQIEIGKPKKKGDFLITKFKPTVPMSSYLLAISISDFKYIEGRTSNGLRIRVWLPVANISKGDFSLKAGLKCIEGMEELYGLPYPMEKIDMIGVNPFGHGAMENYGLIVFHHEYLMYKKGVSKYNHKLLVASIIAHEMAHQWFGNLVTMEWWDNAWLNEGFASYFEIAGREIIFDGLLDAKNNYIALTQTKVFREHNEWDSYPLIQKRNNTFDEYTEQFRFIYMKGGSVLLMFRQLLGKGFDEAIKKYLAENSFNTVDHTTLLRYLEQAVPKDLVGPQGETPLNFKKFADKWLRQRGYPIISVEEIEEDKVKITQSNPFDYKWDVPLWIQEKNLKFLKWLPFERDLIISTNKQTPLVVNYDSHAVVTVNYTRKGWKKIFKQLREDHTIYSDQTKHRLIFDAYYSYDQTEQEIVDALTPYLIKEKEYLPWYAMADYLSKSMQVKLPQELIDVLHKEEVTIVDEASYLENRTKDQQRGIYCRFTKKCRHKRHVPASADMLMNH